MILLLVMVALLAACGATPAQPAPAEQPATQEEAQPAPEETTEEEATAPTEEVAEPTEEAAMAEPTDEADDIGEVAEAVQGSDIAKELDLGVTVVSEEEVISPRDTDLFGGEYRDVSTSDAVSFHPYLTSDSASRGYSGLVYYRGLLNYDENTLELEPNWAESYTISDDGLTFIFVLRDNLQWSDGEPLTAQDYEWTYQQAIKPENEYPYLSQLEFIDSVTAVDDHTLEIKITEVYAPALGQVDLLTPLPKHIWEDLDWKDPEKNSEILHPTVVSGPYKLAEWERDQYAIFEANENYWYHGAPNIERQIVEIVPDEDVAFEKFKSGESDSAASTPEKLEEAKQLPNVNVYEWWSVSASTSFIGLNVREGFVTADKNVRHALNYALDKELLTEEVMLGQAKRLCSIYPETSWAYTPDVPCYDYDPDKAVELLAEAGYTLNDEGLMVDESGEQLTLRLLYGPNTNQSRELIAVTTQDYLADIGINVEIEALEWASFLEKFRAEEPDWDMVILSVNSTPEPHTSFPWWTRENIPELNFSAYINDDVEQLFDEAGGTYDLDVRKEKYAEIQQIIAEDAPRIFLFYSKSRSGQNKRIEGIEPTRLGIGWNSEEWFIAEE
jgi:peptide/nickel transport system substrate-binding protein